MASAGGFLSCSLRVLSSSNAFLFPGRLLLYGTENEGTGEPAKCRAILNRHSSLDLTDRSDGLALSGRSVGLHHYLPGTVCLRPSQNIMSVTV